MTTLFKHIRQRELGFKQDGGFGFVTSNKGGFTFAFKIIKEDENSVEIDFGASVCSDDDNFCRKTGRTVAEQRLVDNPVRLVVPVGYKDMFRNDTTAPLFSIAMIRSVYGDAAAQAVQEALNSTEQLEQQMEAALDSD